MNRKIVLPALAFVAAFSLSGCLYDTTDNKTTNQRAEQNQANVGISEILRNQPVPAFAYSQIRQNLVEIETAQAQGVQTTTFFFNQGVPDPIMSCPSIGAPIATTTELTNPQQTDPHGGQYGGGNTVISQMDPTGVYTGQSSGTYIMCIDAQGKPYATYWEGFVQTVFGPATWDKNTHQVQLTGPASFNFSKPKK